MATLGLDLGTSAVKALLLGDDGSILAVASAPCSVHAPHPGWAEADPGTWLEAAGAAVRRARAGPRRAGAGGRARRPHARGRALRRRRPAVPAGAAVGRPARDGRARALARPSRAAAGSAGKPARPRDGGPAAGLLARGEPEAVRAARWALQAKDWLRLALTGEPATEATDASATLLWDLPADDWATDVAAAAGVDPTLLAPVVESGQDAGALSVSGAEALGLPAGIPVHAGAADTDAALLGAGITEPGRRLLNLGTGAQLVTAIDSPDAASSPTTHRYRAVGGGWYAMGAVQNAGLALGWVRELLNATWEQAEREAFAEVTPGDGDPLFVPHLTGERTPLLDPGARGAWTGLALEHRRGDLLRAAYESVAHAVLHAREALDAEGGGGSGPLRLLGGGSLRPGYRRLLADTVAEPLELLDVADATALGAARLAGATAPEPRSRTTIEPDPVGVERAAARHELWKAAVGALGQARRG